MAKYFGAPWDHPPTVPDTAAHYRAQNIAAMIFPVDAEREPGYRRYRNGLGRQGDPRGTGSNKI